jgi:hypothetical protein
MLLDPADMSAGTGWLVWVSASIALVAVAVDLVLARLDRLRRLSEGMRYLAHSDVVGPMAVGLIGLCVVVASGEMVWYRWTLKDAPFALAPAGKVFSQLSGVWGPPGTIPETWGVYMATVSGPIQGQGIVDGGLAAYAVLFLLGLALLLITLYRALVGALGPTRASTAVMLVCFVAIVGFVAMQDRYDVWEWVWRHRGYAVHSSWVLMATLDRVYLVGPFVLLAGTALAVTGFLWACRSGR